MRERRCRIWHAAASERPLPACGERVGVRGLGSSRPRPLTRSAEPVLGLAGQDPSQPSPRFAGRGVSRRALLAGTRRARRAWPSTHRSRGDGSRDRIAWALDLRRAEIPGRLQAFRLRQPGGAEGRHARTPDQARRRQPELRHLQHAQHLRPQGRRRGRHGRDLRQPHGRFRRRPGRALRPPRPQGALVGRQAHLPLPAASRSALPRRIAGDGAGRRLLDQHPEDQGPPELSHGAERGLGGRGRVATTSSRSSCRRNAAATCTSSSAATRCSRRPTGGTATSRPRRSSRRSPPAPTRSGGSSRGASSSSTACPIIGAAICR